MVLNYFCYFAMSLWQFFTLIVATLCSALAFHCKYDFNNEKSKNLFKFEFVSSMKANVCQNILCIYIYILYIIYYIYIIYYKYLSSFQKLCHIDKASEKKRNICNFNKFCMFFLFIYIWSHTFKVGICHIYIYIYIYIYILHIIFYIYYTLYVIYNKTYKNFKNISEIQKRLIIQKKIVIGLSTMTTFPGTSPIL